MDGAAANAPTGTIARTNTIILFIVAPRQSESEPNSARRKLVTVEEPSSKPVAQLIAQPSGQETPCVYDARNAHFDTAGLVILHQQYTFSSWFEDMDSVELVPPTPLMSELQAATPLIDVVIPFEVHVFAQSVEYEYDDALSVDVQVVFNVFNATHFVTAWAPVVVIAQSIAPARIIFNFIF